MRHPDVILESCDTDPYAKPMHVTSLGIVLGTSMFVVARRNFRQSDTFHILHGRQATATSTTDLIELSMLSVLSR